MPCSGDRVISRTQAPTLGCSSPAARERSTEKHSRAKTRWARGADDRSCPRGFTALGPPGRVRRAAACVIACLLVCLSPRALGSPCRGRLGQTWDPAGGTPVYIGCRGVGCCCPRQESCREMPWHGNMRRHLLSRLAKGKAGHPLPGVDFCLARDACIPRRALCETPRRHKADRVRRLSRPSHRCGRRCPSGAVILRPYMRPRRELVVRAIAGLGTCKTVCCPRNAS